MKSILLVEDDPFLVDLYDTKLKSEGFEVEIATKGSEVFKKLMEKKPDLLLLDIVLPDVDGWEILEKIRENENLRDIKIFVLSNLGEKRDIEKARELGVTEYLIKAHYKPSEVVEEIKKIFQ